MSIIGVILIVAQSLFGGLPVDGIQCEQSEGVLVHIHMRLQLFDRARAVQIPAGVGMAQATGCLYWLHTHTADGYIHIESPVKRDFTLGQFFDVWGVALSWKHADSIRAAAGKHLAIWVDGKPWHGRDPRAIVLKDHESIVIQNGPPYAKPAASDWSKL